MSEQFSRRTAVKAATILPLAMIRGTAANSAVSVGLIGAGSRGTYVTGLVAKNTPARVVAICDVVDGKSEKAAKAIGVESPQIYKDYHQLLSSDVNAVIIATPVFLHAEHFEAAVKAGKHIYIEKPASADVEGCKRIMRAADAADRKLHITFGFQRRYGQVYQKAKQLADSGALGPIRLGHAHFIKSEGAWMEAEKLPPPKTQMEKIAAWHGWKDLSGDLIVENNVHSIDVLNWFLGGRPKSAIGAGGSTLPKRGDMRDHNFVAFEYDNGVQGQLSGTTLAPRGYRDVAEQFFGEKGMVETSENHWRHYRGPGEDTTEKSPRNISIDSMADFISRVAEGRPENNGVRGAESSLTAILGRMAMDRRREVTWDEMMKSS
ncbi:MAG TPA: Gfo/Idh/MocA family oxidoreductase [Bryobacteraceae bacterium]|nr:Gfo/Idh/MocA family oxidoreductase [Bryobacteraceae bacterium]